MSKKPQKKTIMKHQCPGDRISDVVGDCVLNKELFLFDIFQHVIKSLNKTSAIVVLVASQ